MSGLSNLFGIVAPANLLKLQGLYTRIYMRVAYMESLKV
jgi:hypothetical protein